MSEPEKRCGTCAHINTEDAPEAVPVWGRFGCCTNQASWHQHRILPLIECCTRWEPQEAPDDAWAV